MKTREDEFAALLRWYPRRWRAAHGAIVLGTLLDQAEASGRDHPSPAQRRSAAWDGLGHHLDRRLAIVTAIIAALLSIIAVVAMYAVAPVLSGPGTDEITVGTVASAVRMFAIAASLTLTIVSLIATLRPRGLPAVWAVWAALVGLLAGMSVGIVQLSWSVGFDAADAGVPPSALGDALPALLLSSMLLGGATAMFASAPFVRGRLAAAAWPVTFFFGAAAWALAVGTYLALNPPITLLCALGALVIAADPLSPRRAAEHRAALPAPSPPCAHQRRMVARLCAVASVAGLAAIAFCIAGPSWTSLDGTRALQVGIGVGLLAACPLAVAAALPRAGHTDRVAPARAWAPPTLWCVGLIIAASANLFAAPNDSNTIFVLLQVAAVPLSIGTAWWIATSPHGTPTTRRVGAVAAALALLVVAGLMGMLQALPFVTPVVAGIVAVATSRPRRPVQFGVAPGR